MTALDQYERLEATGLWRETSESQSIEVLITFGNASLILSDFTGSPLTHWSLPAVIRLNTGKIPALYSPNSSGVETIEIEDNAMVIAIEEVRKSIKNRRPRQGKLRILTLLITFLIITSLSIFWLPNVLIQHTSGLVYVEQRKQIGARLMDQISKLIGTNCTTQTETNPLYQLKNRLFADRNIDIFVFSDGIKTSTHLPGQFILLNRSVVEDFETPEVAAGFVIIEKIKIDNHDPVKQLLSFAGTREVLKFLTTGRLNESTLEAYAKYILSIDPSSPQNTQIISAFKSNDVNLKPYAYAMDITGESNSELIQDNDNSQTRQILSEIEWLDLQSICGG